MGSCNFGFGYHRASLAFGIVPEYPSDERVAEWVEEMGESPDDVADIIYESDQDWAYEVKEEVEDDLTDIIKAVVRELWKFDYIGGQCGVEFPYELCFDTGYYDGWAVYLNGTHAERANDDNDHLAYLDMYGLALFPPEDGYVEYEIRNVCDRYGSSYIAWEDFQAHVEKVLDAVQWAFQKYCVAGNLSGIADGFNGWCCGAYKVDEEDLFTIKHADKWAGKFGHLFN